MKIVELVRLEESDEGTFGILKINKEVFCCTLEPKDMENAVNISSIPAQQYICVPYNSPTHAQTYRILDVPGRTNILFHAGNEVKDTEGCILLGQYFGKLRGNKRVVLNSGTTFKRFMLRMNNTAFHLTIQEHF